MVKTLSPSRGIVLAEAIAGTVILAIVLVVSLGVTGRALRAQAAGERAQTAAMLIDSKLNEVLMLGVELYQSEATDDGVFPGPFERYSYATAIRGGRSGDPYDVHVTVSWISRGKTRSETVSTLISPRLGDEPDPDRRPEERIDRGL